MIVKLMVFNHFYFVGWSHSCTSVVGSLLDTHPNIIVAHEY